MHVQQTIEKKLKESLAPEYLQVINESFMHSVPPGSESHFKVVVVSKNFEGKTLVARHQMINKILVDEFKESVHALTMQIFTPEEWEKRGGKVNNSPPCLGGSKTNG